jgi:D-alanyl-D-alanine carboxypeptidase
MRSMTPPAMTTAVVSGGNLTQGDLGARPVPWWSFTKTVLAAAALVLVRDGRLTLDTLIDDRPYTLRQLLRHTAGVPNYSDLETYQLAVAHNDEPWSTNEMLGYVQADKLLFEPGKGWRYSNTGYLLVRHIVEAAMSTDLQAALQHLVFSPLGIHDVAIARGRADLEATEWSNPIQYHPGWVYHGLLIGPPTSAALWLDRLIEGELLPADLVTEMCDRFPLGQEIPGRPWVNFGYGLGMMVALDGPAGQSVGHTGTGPMSVAAVYRFANYHRTVAAFAPIGEQAPIEWAVHTLAMAEEVCEKQPLFALR